MKEEIRRINKLVAEGKITPEDAADLIDAFYNSEREEFDSNPPTPPSPPQAESTNGAYASESKPRDPFQSMIDAIERLGKEVTENIDWKQVTEGARTNAKKGLDILKTGIEEVSKGKFNLGWMFSTSTREVRLPLAISAGQILKIENGCGDIEVSTDTAESYVVAKAWVRGATPEDAKAKADAYSLVVDSSEHSISIKQPQVSGLEVNLKIVIAAGLPLEIRSESGDVIVKGTNNSCRIQSATGLVQLSNVANQVEIHCDSGDVSVRDSNTSNVVIENKTGDIVLTSVKGDANLRSATGNISVHAGTGKTVSIEAVSGNVFYDAEAPVVGTLNVRTVNGNAEVFVPAGSDARVAVSTLRGVASTEIELNDRAQSDQRVTGTIGDGMGSIEISAVTGNVSLSQKEAVTSGGNSSEEWANKPDFS